MKKLILSVLGVLLALLFIECSLQIVSLIYRVQINISLENSLKNKKNITVLCIGESTTAEQYPIQLQEFLDKKYPDKFSVVDCGVKGQTTPDILLKLKEQIKEYNPSIIVSMIGINDWKILPWDKNTYSIFHKLFYKFKIYKVCCYFIDYFESLQKQDDRELFILKDMFSQYLENKEYDTENKKNNSELISNIITYENKLKETYNNYNNKNLRYRLFKECGINNDFAFWYQILLSTNTSNNNKIIYNPEIFDMNMANNDFLNNVNEQDYTDVFYGHIAVDFLKNNDIQKAKENFNKAEQYRLKHYSFNTQKTYEEIINIAFDNNIKFIAMQYPMRSIDSLKVLLKNSRYYDNIIFISNENDFKNYLYNGGIYEDLFTDQFAGDFGHATVLGNEIIAKNIEKTLRENF